MRAHERHLSFAEMFVMYLRVPLARKIRARDIVSQGSVAKSAYRKLARHIWRAIESISSGAGINIFLVAARTATTLTSVRGHTMGSRLVHR